MKHVALAGDRLSHALRRVKPAALRGDRKRRYVPRASRRELPGWPRFVFNFYGVRSYPRVSILSESQR